MRNTGKHIAQPGGLHGGDKIAKGKKRANESFDYHLPTKKSRKEANKLFSAQICTDSGKDQPNSDAMANLTQHADDCTSDGSCPCNGDQGCHVDLGNHGA